MRPYYDKVSLWENTYNAGVPKSHDVSIPHEVLAVTEALEKAGFEAYIVGGCVRDLLLGREPKDWDVATNARPEEIQKLFSNTFYTNEFGTVGVVNEEAVDLRLKVIEVTPYRREGKYSDARRPDSVEFGATLEEDLKRRDFTINALALNPHTGEVVDHFEGEVDLKKKLVRAVGEPADRFAEDALRMLRAIRIATDLTFSLEERTAAAIEQSARSLSKISKERIRDEFVRILQTDSPAQGLWLAEKLKVLPFIAGELEQGIGVDQNQAHKFDVFEHNLRTLQHAADKGWSLDLRLAGLFHDIAKPETRRWSDEKKDWTFYGHDVVGAKRTKKILTDLRFPSDTISKVVELVRWHMFFSDPEKITLSAVRRVIRNVGPENIWDLMNLRVCDRIGTGRPKEQPFRFRKYQSMVEEALRDPISVGMLKIDGVKVMEVTNEKPGPKIGFVLHALLEEVLDDPKKNSAEYLESRSKELVKLSEAELKKLGDSGKEKKAEAEGEEIKKIRGRYHVS